MAGGCLHAPVVDEEERGPDTPLKDDLLSFQERPWPHSREEVRDDRFGHPREDDWTANAARSAAGDTREEGPGAPLGGSIWKRGAKLQRGQRS